MEKFKFAVLISGSGTNLQALINKFAFDKRIEICCVISNSEEAYGLERAKNAGIDNLSINHNNFSSRKEFEEALIKSLSEYNPDLIVLAGFMRILSEVFVNRYSDRLVNIHPSLLPKYKGLETHKRVIENKEKYHGVTVHFVDESLDGGPICAQSRIKVETDDPDELKKSIHKLEYELYPTVIEEIANGKLFLSNGKVIRK